MLAESFSGTPGEFFKTGERDVRGELLVFVFFRERPGGSIQLSLKFEEQVIIAFDTNPENAR